MGQLLTTSERFFTADGTEINVSVNPSEYRDATTANATAGGFDTVFLNIGRFIGYVNLIAYDARGGFIGQNTVGDRDVNAQQISVRRTGEGRIAYAVVEYHPDQRPVETVVTTFWVPTPGSGSGSGGGEGGGGGGAGGGQDQSGTGGAAFGPITSTIASSARSGIGQQLITRGGTTALSAPATSTTTPGGDDGTST